MNLGAIYDFFVREGIRRDPRKKSQITRALSSQKIKYKKLSKVSKKFFDKECLTNPYSDTRILYGDRKKNIRRVLVGIDIEIGELLMARKLSEQGTEIDLVIGHHPEGIALSGLDEVMHLQTDCLVNLGIDPGVAQRMMESRIGEVGRRLHGANHSRAVDAARLLGQPFMCCHTPADNHVAEYLQKKMDRLRPKTLQDIVHVLLKEPEYQDAAANKAGPTILIGEAKDNAGKIIVDMTGGTEGSVDLFGRLSQLGIKTQLSMHLSEQHYKKIKLENINVVIAGHMASDNLGMNLLLDQLDRKGKIEVVACSGFRRVRR